MGLIINNQLFKTTEDNRHKIYLALTMIPEPSVKPMHAIDIPDQAALLCHQREMLYLSSQSPFNTKKFVGTKEVASCVAVILYNDESECFLVHIDGANFDFSIEIAKFKNLKNLKAILVGAGDRTSLSEDNVDKTLEWLMQASEKLAITIEIVAQKILARNRFCKADRYDYCYDLIIFNAKILAKRYFNTVFDLNKFKHTIKIPEFKKPTSKAFLDVRFAFHITLTQSAGAITKKYGSIDDYIGKLSLEEFYKQFDALFSPIGFNYLNDILTEEKAYNAWSIPNFVFDLNSQELIRIPLHTPTENEIDRQIAKIPNCAHEQNYVYGFDPKTGAVYQPKFTKEFMAKCYEMKKLFSRGPTDAALLFNTLGLEFDLADLMITQAFIAKLELPAQASQSSQPLIAAGLIVAGVGILQACRADLKTMLLFTLACGLVYTALHNYCGQRQRFFKPAAAINNTQEELALAPPSQRT